MQTHRNYSTICWRLSEFKSPSQEKSSFLKPRGFFSFKFFQGHNWLTNYLDSEFHGHWKTVTLSSIRPNLSKHWRFLAFWLSLCFGSFLLFLICHDTAFLFSTGAMLFGREKKFTEKRLSIISWFFAKIQEARELIKNRELYLYVSSMYHAITCLTVKKLSYLCEHSEVSQARHCTRAGQECCIMTS